MKRFFIILSILFIGFNVNARELGSLIPVNTSASLKTENFFYDDFYYNDNKMEADSLKDNYVIFGSIKNMTNETKPVSITIGLFNEDKKNIGVIYYCSSKDKVTASAGALIQPEQAIPAVVQIKENQLVEGNTMNDIKYISVLDENIECKQGFRTIFAGMNVDEINLKRVEPVVSKSETKGFGMAFGLLFGIVIAFVAVRFLLYGKSKSQNDIRKEMIKKHEENVTINDVVKDIPYTTPATYTNVNTTNNTPSNSTLSNNENVVTTMIPDFEKNPDAKVNPVPSTVSTIPATVSETTPPTEPSGESDLLNMFK